LSFDSGGVLSGTPASVGTYQLTVQASDSQGSSARATVALTVQTSAKRPTLRPDQPVIESFSGLPKLSPGTWIELYGQNLATTARSWTQTDFLGNTAPTILDGVGVLIDNVPAFISYISPNQINALVPNVNISGTSTIVVTGPTGLRSDPITLQITPVAPALLAPAAFKAGSVQYVAAHFSDLSTFAGPPDLSPGAVFKRPKPNDYIILYALGCGPTQPSVSIGDQAPTVANLLRPIQVTVGGKVAAVQYAGLYPPFVGLYRIDVIVPSVEPGDQQIEVSVDGVSAGQTLYLAIGQ
jgi:uncharacterized protein (TIGR03437 family)